MADVVAKSDGVRSATRHMQHGGSRRPLAQRFDERWHRSRPVVPQAELR